jgi:TRAP-type C4-dicarboxylate transport system substrate-binding protein
MKTKTIAAAVLSTVLALLNPVAQAADEITAVHAFPPFLVYTKTFLAIVDDINARGEGVIKINVRGGPEAIGMFEQPNAVRDGVVDMVHTPGSFYGASVPEIDAMVASKSTPMEVRENGGAALMDEVHQQRFNVKHLGWVDGGIRFHIYMVNEPKLGDNGVLDLTGVKLRDNPIYHAFFESLNATTASMPSTEVYAALEKGVVDATAWTSIGIQDLKWDKFIKYRVDPAFYSTDIGIIVNLDTWNDLSDESKQIIQDTIIEWEGKSYNDRQQDRETQVADLVANGMQIVAMEGEAAAAYEKMSVDASWARMKERLEDMGGMENYDKLRTLYYPE